MNHFYDPIHDAALTSGCAIFGYNGTCFKSVDWALGYIDSFASPPQVDLARRNHFSYADARQNMWLALIGARGRAAASSTAAERAADAQERLFRWATTFASLGHVIHLLQDGAQPQHVRNDPHSPITTSKEQQAYEGYTNGRVLRKNASFGNAYVQGFFTGGQDPQLPDIVTGTYPVPIFATPVRFFTTRLKTDTASTSPDGRYGLMDYTNRGFFTGGTLPDSGNTFPEPPLTLDAAHGYTSSTVPCVISSEITKKVGVKCTHLMHSVEDNVSSIYTDELPHAPGQSSAFTAPPVISEGAFKFAFSLFGTVPPGQGYAVGLEEFDAMGNLAIPRAIAYSAGVVNYFFRGQFAVTAPPDKIVGVLNQGAQHTMNAQGYPCVGTASNDGCPIFGFQSIRVSVQNVTPQITESGSGTVSAQNLSATAFGSVTDPNFHGPYLVAVAKYHRNTCYKPDLSGEPYQIYNPPTPTTGITQPTCGAGQTTRTAYQEISVSKSFAATAAQLVANAPAFEAHFDFSADPIPVNATDLFIQVVYRGPMGDANGQEPDAIAVGTLDVREPTFAAFWNNTDYFWNSNWLHENSLHHNEGIETFWACMGGFPVKMVFEYDGAVGSPAMVDPIVNSGKPGMVRLAAIFPPPDFAGQQKNVRAVPIHYPGDQLIVQESVPTRGVFRQANLENVDVSTLIPYAGCATTLPTDPKYWCFDPIEQRRSQLFGSPFSPLYIDLSFDTASDVDSVPLLAFSGTMPLATGTNRFDTDATLASCTTQPAAPTTPDDQAYQTYLHFLDVLEEARDLGVSGEAEPQSQQRQQ